MWMAYQIQRYAIVSTPSLMIPFSIGGSFMDYYGEWSVNHWGRTGQLFQNSIAAINDAMVQIAALGYTPTLRSIEWCQGESEGSLIAEGYLTKEQAVEKLLDIAAHYREYFPNIRFNIYRTGTLPPNFMQGDTGFAEIRWAQEEAARRDPRINIVYRGAVGFAERNLINADNVHWSQAGLNEAGMVGAMNGFN